MATCVFNTADCTPVVRLEAPPGNKGPWRCPFIYTMLLQSEHDSSGPAVGLRGSLPSVPLCLLPPALLVVPSVLAVAPLCVCQSVLSPGLSVCSPVVSISCSVFPVSFCLFSLVWFVKWNKRFRFCPGKGLLRQCFSILGVIIMACWTASLES